MDHAAIAGFNRLDRSILAVATYPLRWQRIYMARALHLRDPVLALALQAQGPVDWADLRDDPRHQDICAAAQAFGIGPNGVSVPLHLPNGDVSVLSVTRACPPEIWARQRCGFMDQLQDQGAELQGMLARIGGGLAAGAGVIATARARAMLGVPACNRAPGARQAASMPPRPGLSVLVRDALRGGAAPGSGAPLDRPRAQDGALGVPVDLLARDGSGAVTGSLRLCQSTGGQTGQAQGSALPRAPGLWLGSMLRLAKAAPAEQTSATLRALVSAACQIARSAGVQMLLVQVDGAQAGHLRAAGCRPDADLGAGPSAMGPDAGQASPHALVYDCARVLRDLPVVEILHPERTAPARDGAPAALVFVPGQAPVPPSPAELTDYCLEQIAAAKGSAARMAALALAETLLAPAPKPRLSKSRPGKPVLPGR